MTGPAAEYMSKIAIGKEKNTVVWWAGLRPPRGRQRPFPYLSYELCPGVLIEIT
jgi:hypothetical protein